MKKYLFAIVANMLLCGFSYAHDHRPLSQQSLLGVMPESHSGNEAAQVSQVLSGSTGEALGLIPGDKIVSVNGIKIIDFAHLVTVIQSLDVGDSVEVEALRDNKNISLSADLKGRPREKSKGAEVIYDTVYLADGRLRSIVYKPHTATGKRVPAVFFIQGYTCGSVDDGMFPSSTTRQMTQQWVDAGFVVYKVEKYGVGESQTEQLCSQIGFDKEVEGFQTALKALKKYEFVDPEQVYLFGHSLGVLVAPLLASKDDVAGVSGYGGVVKSWFDYTLDIYGKQTVEHFDVSQQQAMRNVKRVTPFMRAWLSSDMSLDKLKQSVAYKTVMEHNLVPIEGDQIFHRHYSFFREVNQHDFRKIWSELNVPVLVMHGSLDIQAINGDWAFEIADIVNKRGKRQLARAEIIKNAEHAFMSYPSKQSYQQARSSRTYRPSQAGKQYENKIGQHVIDWINATVGSSAG